MPGKHVRVVVIGGGLAGLVAAHRLARDGREVTLLEAYAVLGGQIRTARMDGCVVEHGAEGFVARSEAVPALATELGIGDELIGQSTLRSLGCRDGALIELAPGEAGAFLGLQVPEEDLGKGIRTFRGGMGSLTDALQQALRGRVRVFARTSAAIIERATDGLAVHCEDGRAFTADRVVVATPAQAASDALATLADEAAYALTNAPTLSSVTVTAAYARRAIADPLDATGFVVAPGQEHEGLRACTFVSSKFVDRAPADTALLRFFFRPAAGECETLDDGAWSVRASGAAVRILGVSAAPKRVWVSRWPDALPVHTPEYRQHVATLERALAGTGVVLAGSAFHGSGIDAAVRSGHAAAAAVA